MKTEKSHKKTLGIIILIIACMAPLFSGSYMTHLFILAILWSVVVASWDILVGYLGIFSFTQVGFLAIAGYFSAIISMRLGISPWLTLFMAILFNIIVSFIVGWITLRLQGAYIAIITVAFVQILQLIISNWTDVTRGEKSLWGIPPLFQGSNVHNKYYICILIIAVILIAFMYYMSKSKYGYAAKAIKESSKAAESLGINISQFKIIGFILSAAITGVMGWFYAHYINVLSPNLLKIDHMVDVLIMGMVGGIGTILGPIIGSFLITFVLEILRDIGTYRFLIYGALIIIIMLYQPKGVYGMITTLIHKRKNHEQQ